MEIHHLILLVLLITFAVQTPRANAHVPATEETNYADARLPTSCERLKYENGQLFFFRCSRHARSTSYEVRNALGQVLAAGKMTSSTLIIGKLDAGVYYVSLRIQSGDMKMLRVVVQA